MFQHWCTCTNQHSSTLYIYLYGCVFAQFIQKSRDCCHESHFTDITISEISTRFALLLIFMKFIKNGSAATTFILTVKEIAILMKEAYKNQYIKVMNLYNYFVSVVFKQKLGTYYGVITFANVFKWGFQTWNHIRIRIRIFYWWYTNRQSFTRANNCKD